jgi:hypothetical protein
MSGLCRFSGALGEPGKGVHSVRVAGFAAVDVLATALLAFFLARKKGRKGLSLLGIFVLYFLLLVLLAIGVHKLFCVNTRLNVLMFGRAAPLKVGTTAI